MLVSVRAGVLLAAAAAMVPATAGMARSAAQDSAPTLTATVNDLLALCAKVRDSQQFGARARELGWKYDMATGKRERELPFGKVALTSGGNEACTITFAMARPADVIDAVEKWGRTADGKAAIDRKPGGPLYIGGADYTVLAEAGSSAAIVKVQLR